MHAAKMREISLGACMIKRITGVHEGFDLLNDTWRKGGIRRTFTHGPSRFGGWPSVLLINIPSVTVSSSFSRIHQYNCHTHTP